MVTLLSLLLGFDLYALFKSFQLRQKMKAVQFDYIIFYLYKVEKLYLLSLQYLFFFLICWNIYILRKT